MTSDHRITPGLIHDIVDPLKRHGYYRSDDQHAHRAIGLTDDLARIYEGTDQSCPDCQTHLHDIRAFDQMADRTLQAAQAAATASRPGPDRRDQPAADREAGQ